MSTPDPVPPPVAPAIPWYQSRVQIAQVVTLLSALAAISPKVAATLGLTSLANIQSTVEAVFGTIAFLAPVVGTVFRAKSAIQPLTLTKAAAAAHPATVAAEAITTQGAQHASSPPPAAAGSAAPKP